MQWLRTLRQDYPRLSRWVLGGGTFPSTVVGGRDGLCSHWRKKQGGGHQPRICISLEDVLERMRKWVLQQEDPWKYSVLSMSSFWNHDSQVRTQHCEVISLAVFSVTKSLGICYSCSKKSNIHCSIGEEMWGDGKRSLPGLKCMWL